MKKFWNWIKDSDETRTLRLEGPIDEESFWGDEITPQMFRDELESGEGDVTVWINSPGGNVFAAAEIYTMLKDYKGSITVKIDAIAASAASVVAMAGDVVQMSPVAMLMIHDPSTVAMGNTKDMEKAIEVLNEVKESIINAYASKSGLSHARIANFMSNETWMNAKKAVELGFADEVLFEAKQKASEEPEQTPDEKPGEGEEKQPIQKDAAGHLLDWLLFFALAPIFIISDTCLRITQIQFRQTNNRPWVIFRRFFLRLGRSYIGTITQFMFIDTIYRISISLIGRSYLVTNTITI